MCVENERDLQGLMRIGKVVGLTIQTMADQLRAGMTTRELDQIGWEVLKKHGARPAPFLTYDFPGITCISVNDEAAHGVPGDRVIRSGDLVKIDASAELNGYWADAAITVGVDPVAAKHQRLIACAQRACENAIAAARTEVPLYEIGRAAERVARSCGYRIIRELPGHGVGRALHEAPEGVPMFADRRARGRLPRGQVITIEPHLSVGDSRIVTERDGWTLRTRDRSLAAAWEHTIVITDGKPIIVTAV
jgi:methionyl aminopeptidase